MLVILQFALSATLVSCAYAVYQQIDFLQEKEVGYMRENIIQYRSTTGIIRHYDRFIELVKQIPGVVATASANFPPYNVGASVSLFWEGKPEDQTVLVQNYAVNYDLLPLLGIRIIQGRNFSRDFPADSTAVIVTEELARIMGFKDPVGRKVNNNATIIGVASDFNTLSLHSQLNPVMLRLGNDHKFVFIRVAPGMTASVLPALESVHREIDSVFPVSYSLLDDSFNKLYAADFTMANLSAVFTVVALVICILGLVSLVTYTIEKRNREIAIRKVLGATTWQVMAMFSLTFARLILVATLVSVPISWLIVENYLSGFAYHFNLDAWVFVIPCAGLFLLALLNTCLQCLKAATMNPAIVMRAD
jgi:putative ABC transport system permease protein